MLDKQVGEDPGICRQQVESREGHTLARRDGGRGRRGDTEGPRYPRRCRSTSELFDDGCRPPPAFIIQDGRRSSSHPHAQKKRSTAFVPKMRRPTTSGNYSRAPRRCSESDIRRLRNKAKSSTNEIEALKARIAMLEGRLATVEGAKKSTNGSSVTNGTMAIPALIENSDTQSNT